MKRIRNNEKGEFQYVKLTNQLLFKNIPGKWANNSQNHCIPKQKYNNQASIIKIPW